jgi:hypothetical protein
MHVALVLSGQMAQIRQVRQVIAVRSKASVSVIAALNEVQRDAGEDQPRVSGHIAKTPYPAAR